MSEPRGINFDDLKPEEFEQYLPELFATGDGKVSQDPRLQKFLARNPDCAALVNDLETIAAHALAWEQKLFRERHGEVQHAVSA